MEKEKKTYSRGRKPHGSDSTRLHCEKRPEVAKCVAYEVTTTPLTAWGDGALHLPTQPGRRKCSSMVAVSYERPGRQPRFEMEIWLAPVLRLVDVGPAAAVPKRPLNETHMGGDSRHGNMWG
jgi:hypothetical protein